MTKRRSKDMKGDPRDLVWWWDQPPSINDESWAQLLALANPKLSPDCAAAKDARRRAELAVQVLLRGQQVLLRGQQETFILAEKAEDGISFLAKLEAVTFWTQVTFPEKEMELDALKETVRNITILIDFTRMVCFAHWV